MSTTAASPFVRPASGDAITPLLYPGPEYAEAIRVAHADADAEALLNDYITGVLRRVNKLIKDGLPPLNSFIAGYERISDDKEGHALGVTRQRQDNDGLAAADGFFIPEQARFRDNDTGASTRSKKRREHFERLLAYIVTGQVKVVYAYSTSRITRRPLELELLIRLAESFGVRYVTKASGSDDLTTAQGRMIARIKAAVDAAEAEITAERVTRAALDAAQRGIPGGGVRPFGYYTDKVTPDPFEAALIRKAADDIIFGSVSLRSIAKAWQAAGVKTVSAEYIEKRAEKAREDGEEIPEEIPAPWHPNVVRNILKNPRLAGWRTYRGEIAKDTDGRDVRGQWTPILDQDTFDRLQTKISTPPSERQRGKRGSRVYMLSGLLVCAICKGSLYGARVDRPGAGPHRYTCLGSTDNKHVLGVGGKSLDRLIKEAVLAAYEEENVDEAPLVFEDDERIEELREYLDDIDTAYRAGQMKKDRYWANFKKAETELDGLVEKRDEFIRLTAGPPMEKISDEEWEAMTVGERRARVESVIEAIIIKPTTSRGPKLSKDRVDIIWKNTVSA